jgi:hypothetical protein
MMQWARWAVAVLALAAAACREGEAPAHPAQKPELALLTSLPLAFGEGFSLDASRHPLMASLERDYRVTLVDGPEGLPRAGLLLAVQPQALTAERLVALDRWVRGGGRLLLLADPRFEWNGSASLDDKFRPPFSYPDTGLLQHWGLTLSAVPESSSKRQLAGAEVETRSPGEFVPRPSSPCAVSPDRLVARCKLERGRAVVIADADLVQGSDESAEHNRAALLRELGALGRPKP